MLFGYFYNYVPMAADETKDYADILATGSDLVMVVKFSTAKLQEGFMAAYTTVDKGNSEEITSKAEVLLYVFILYI